MASFPQVAPFCIKSTRTITITITIRIKSYFSVCTSTESTPGKSRTIACQLSPPSGEQ